MVVHRGALTLSAISPLPVSRIDFRTRQCLLSPATVPCRQPPARVPCPAHSESLCPFRCHKSRTRLRFSPCTAPSASRFPSQTRGVIPRASSRLRYPPPSNMLLHSRPPPSNMLPRRRAHTSTCGDVVVRFPRPSRLCTRFAACLVDHFCRPCSSGQIWRDPNFDTRVWLAACSPPHTHRRLPGRPFAVISKSLPNALPYLHSSQGAGVGLPWLQPPASHHWPVTRGSGSGAGAGSLTRGADVADHRTTSISLAGIDTRSPLIAFDPVFLSSNAADVPSASRRAKLPSCSWSRLYHQHHRRLRFHQRSLRCCSPASQAPLRTHAGHVSVGLRG